MPKFLTTLSCLKWGIVGIVIVHRSKVYVKDKRSGSSEQMVGLLNKHMMVAPGSLMVSLEPGPWQTAAGCVDVMRTMDINPDSISISASIRACEKGPWQEAVAQLVDCEQQLLHRSAFVRNAALSACSSSNQWQVGLQILAALARYQMCADAVTFNIALSMMHQASSWRSAVGILAFMAEIRTQPELSHLNLIMSCLAKMRQWEQAQQLLQQLKGSRDSANAATYSSLIEACSSDWVLALLMFDQMVVAEIEVDASVAVALLSTGAGRCWQTGICTLEGLRQPQDLAAHNLGVSTLGKLGQWQVGAQCAQKLESLGLQASIMTYTSLLSGVQPGQWPAAMDMLRFLEFLALPPNDFSYSAAIAPLGPAREWQSITSVLREMVGEMMEINQACRC